MNDDAERMAVSALRYTTGPVHDLDELTPRERDVLTLLARGESNPGIAATLRISEQTVKNHITSIYHALRLPIQPGGSNRVKATRFYLDHGGQGFA